MSKPHRSGAFWVVWVAVALLALLHQDIWNWDNRNLVFGVIPTGLMYHAVFSIACAVVWACATRFAWPHHIEEWAEETSGTSSDEVGS